MTASLRARLLNSYLRRRIKPRLRAQPSDPTAIHIARRRMDVTARTFAPKRHGCAIARAVIGAVPVEHVVTQIQPPEPAPRVLYLHGGAFAMGSPATHRPITTAIAHRAGARVVACDYRLTPEHPWPAGLEDAVSVYDGMLTMGTPAGRIVLAGDSAGGNLVLSTLHAIKRRGLPMPAGAVCLSPWCDLAGRSRSVITNATREAMLPAELLPDMARLYAGSEDLTEPTISPLYGDFTGFPPLLLHVGSEEILTDDAVRLHDAAAAAGASSTLTVWPGLPHVFHIFARVLPEARAALDEISRFIRDHAVDNA